MLRVRCIGLAIFFLFGGDVTSAGALYRVESFGVNPGGLVMYGYGPDDLEEGSPLIVLLHGCEQDATSFARNSGWIDLSDRYKFALVMPEQNRVNNVSRCFNWFNGFSFLDALPVFWVWWGSDIDRGYGEADSIASMTLWAANRYKTDKRRIYVAGLSGGAAMALVVLSTYPDIFSGGAVVAGIPYKCAVDVLDASNNKKCGLDYKDKNGNASIESLAPGFWGDKVRGSSSWYKGDWPTLSIWHGLADGTVIPAAAYEIEKQWLNVHGLVRSAIEDQPSPAHNRRRYYDAHGRVVIEVNRIDGLGHGIPVIDGGCGYKDEYFIDVGICASRQISEFWGVVPAE